MVVNGTRKKGTDMSTIKSYQALCDGIASREGADGTATVEYVVIIMFVVGLGAALLAFRQEISNFIQNAQNSVSDMINSLSSGAADGKVYLANGVYLVGEPWEPALLEGDTVARGSDGLLYLHTNSSWSCTGASRVGDI